MNSAVRGTILFLTGVPDKAAYSTLLNGVRGDPKSAAEVLVRECHALATGTSSNLVIQRGDRRSWFMPRPFIRDTRRRNGAAPPPLVCLIQRVHQGITAGFGEGEQIRAASDGWTRSSNITPHLP